MSNHGSIARHFSKGSEVYEQEASLQREIAHELLCRIRLERPVRRILDVGCGTGFLTSLLLGAYPGAQLDAIDISAAMLRKARAQVTDSRVNWILGDAKEHKLSGPYDLIASSSAIQWIYPQHRLFSHLRDILQPDGKLSFSLMLRGTLRELHEMRHQVAPHKPLRAELATAYEIGTAVKQAGMSLLHIEEKIYRKEYDSSADFLWRIKEQGFTGGEVSTAEKVLTRGELRELTARYQKTHRSPHGVTAMYCVGFFEARKWAPKPAVLLQGNDG